MNSLDWYEVVTGLKVVRKAQEDVILAERSFVESQEQRRDTQLHLNGITAKRRELSTELDKVGRGEEKFLQLVTEEHKLIREEQSVRDALNALEAKERNCFALLSANLRDSHEKERIQVEKTKYWSLTASLIGAGIGVFVSTVNNYRRTRDLRIALGEVSLLEESFTKHSETLQSNSADLRRLIERLDVLAEPKEVPESVESEALPSEKDEDNEFPLKKFAFGVAIGLFVGLIPFFSNK